MRVYIKDVEMPKNCYKCDMRRKDGMACIPAKYIANAPTIIPASEENET